MQSEDVWVWEPEKFGFYSVRSAYRLLDRARTRGGATDGPSGSGTATWKKIWKLKVPPKIRVFWWRVMHEFLPAKQILCYRHVEPTANCETCGADEESIRHVLIDCTIAREFWGLTKQLVGVKLPTLHPVTWAHDLLNGRAGLERFQSLIIIGMYALWMQRNRRRHGE